MLILLASMTTPLLAAAPKLNFSDLISGPGAGLGDALGSGVIVTIWGQNMGGSQSTSTVSFTDSGSNVKSAAHVYYWKNADGQLPGGPSNLYASHSMQEVAFSIPDSLSGAGTIHVNVGGQESNRIPFTIRDGNIYHIKSSGNDSTGNGSFGSPYLTVNTAFDKIDFAGSTLYVHDSIVSGSDTTGRAIYWNDSVASSGLSNQYAVVAYPNSKPSAIGHSGFRNYKVGGQVVSKFSIFASNCVEGSNGQPVNCATGSENNISYGIEASAFGRAIGNSITDKVGGCASGTQGAIAGNANSLNRDRVSLYQVLGNEIYEYGCVGSSKLHHTSYLSVRSGSANLQIPPWRFGWNYLHDNDAKNGIHQYDENNSGLECGSPNDTVIINDNVIVNQSGAGISIGANCPWTNDFEVYNNVLINVGLAADWDGVDPETANGPNTSGISVRDGGLTGTIVVFNNTIHAWNNDDSTRDTQACLGMQGTHNGVSVKWENNLCYTSKDKPFVAAGCCGAEVQLDNVTGSNNAWYYSGAAPTLAISPMWDSSPVIADPLVVIIGTQVIIGAGSPIIGKGTNSLLSHDIYGVARLQTPEIGAVEFNIRPNSPANLQIQ
jgi:hypothetical protein